MKLIRLTCLLVFATFAGVASAELPWQFEQHTRYMAMGDSLAAGYGATPATNGYAYLLYTGGAFDRVPNTLLSNVGVPGATSNDVLAYQVPLAVQAFKPQAVTLTVGGNDLLSILNGADPYVVLPDFGTNLWQILGALCEGLPGAAIYVSNLYTVPLPGVDLVDVVVPMFNDVVAQVAAGVSSSGCDVQLVDIYGAFQNRNGLLLIERRQSSLFEVHPTNAGYRVMARTFMKVIEAE
ncbi:SGNH/GDSL hydrolase family protein [Pseudomonadota bacterium]